MKLTALTVALAAALGMTAGCSTQGTLSQAQPAASGADAQYALGRYYQGQQRYELAIEAYRRALAANPAHVGAHNGLGASLLLVGRNAEAAEQFKAGLRHQPRSAALWNNLGYAYALSGENGLAEMAYKQSLDLDPTDLKTSANLAAAQQALSVATAEAPPVQAQAVQAAAEVRTIPLYPVRPAAAPVETAPAPDAPAQIAPSLAMATTVAIKTISVPAETAPAPAVAAKPAAPTGAMPAAAAKPAAPAQAMQTAAAEARSIPLYPSRPAAAKPVEAVPAPIAVARLMDTPARKEPATAKTAIAPTGAAPAIPMRPLADPAVKLQSSTELASAAAASAVQVVKVAPQVYEMKLADTGAASQAPAAVAGAARISLPLRDDTLRTASADAGDFALEIRNGNGIQRMAWRTSQQLAGHGYTTNCLSNARGFNVKVTQVLYLPGYLEEARRLLAHLPKGAVLAETASLRRGSHIRVVLGRDMAAQQAGEQATRTAALDSGDFVLEIRNGNGVRRMALRTSQQLAGHGYTTNYLTNERGFSVKVTKVLYLPGYLEEAKRLLAHLPEDTVLAETSNLRPGVHVRVVLGRDMAQRQARLEAESGEVLLAATPSGTHG